VNANPTEFDAYGRTYDDTVNRALAFSGLRVDFFTRVKADYLLDLLAAALPPGCEGAVLDVGCGVGNYHSLLSGKVSRLVGIEVSAQCIAAARARHPGVEYEVYDGIHIPHADGTFDAAFTICVLHHVPVAQRRALVGDIRRTLRPGGLFAIFEHNPFNPLTRFVVSRCEFDRNAVLLSRMESEALLRETGFSEIESRHILTVPAFNASVRRLDRALGRLRLGAQYYAVGRA
jgi:SAM-dependent methyltransferase